MTGGGWWCWIRKEGVANWWVRMRNWVDANFYCHQKEVFRAFKSELLLGLEWCAAAKIWQPQDGLLPFLHGAAGLACREWDSHRYLTWDGGDSQRLITIKPALLLWASSWSYFDVLQYSLSKWCYKHFSVFFKVQELLQCIAHTFTWETGGWGMWQPVIMISNSVIMNVIILYCCVLTMVCLYCTALLSLWHNC